VPIFTLDIQDAVLRFSLDKAYDQGDVFSTAVKVVLRGFFIVLVGAFVAAMLPIPGLKNSYLLFFVLMYLTTAMYNSVSLFCRGIDKVNVVVLSSILNAAITLLCNILFLVVFKMGLNGYLIANTIGSAVALVVSFFGARLYRYVRPKPPKKVYRDMLSFSFPLIFSVVAWWLNNASDRYILSWLCGVSVSGVYAVSYKIPNLLSVFQNIFAQAWSISAVKEFDKNDSDGFIGNMYTMMHFAMITVCSVIMLFNIPIARILYSNEFFNAYRFVPPLLISVVFNAMALFIGSIFTAVKDTKTLSFSTITGALVNTVCNVVFTYFWGAYGAALATLVGYASVFVMRHIILTRHIKMKINWRRDLIVYGLLLLQMIAAFFGGKMAWLQLLMLLLILLLYRKEMHKAIYLVLKKTGFSIR